MMERNEATLRQDARTLVDHDGRIMPQTKPEISSQRRNRGLKIADAVPVVFENYDDVMMHEHDAD
jgi:hypothetical protein